MDGAEPTRTVEVTLSTTCGKCGAVVGVYGPHLSVPCACGNRIGVPTAVLAAALAAFEDERTAGEVERGGSTWKWTARASAPSGDALREVDAPVLLVAQVPNALRVIGGDDGEQVHTGPGPRWWVVLAGIGRVAQKRLKREERLRKQAEIDAIRLREYEASLAETERHKAYLAERRAEERQEHDRASRWALGFAWVFVGMSSLGMFGASTLLGLGEGLDLPELLVMAGRFALLVSGALMGLFGLTVSSAAAAYRVHEPLLAYVGFAFLVAIGAALPGLGIGIAGVYAFRLARGLDPTLRDVRRTTPGGGRPMAAALLAFCAQVQFGIWAISGSALQEIFGNLADGLGI